MSGRLLACTVPRTRLIHYRFEVDSRSSRPGRPSLATLIIILRTGVSHKVKITIGLTLSITTMACRVILLPFHVAALLFVSRLFIIRLGVLGTVRVGILDKSHHELPHGIAVALKSSKLLLEGEETAIFLQHQNR